MHPNPWARILKRVHSLAGQLRAYEICEPKIREVSISTCVSTSVTVFYFIFLVGKAKTYEELE